MMERGALDWDPHDLRQITATGHMTSLSLTHTHTLQNDHNAIHSCQQKIQATVAAQNQLCQIKTQKDTC